MTTLLEALEKIEPKHLEFIDRLTCETTEVIDRATYEKVLQVAKELANACELAEAHFKFGGNIDVRVFERSNKKCLKILNN